MRKVQKVQTVQKVQKVHPPSLKLRRAGTGPRRSRATVAGQNGLFALMTVIAIITVAGILTAAGGVSAADISIESGVFKPLGNVDIPTLIGRIIRGLIGISGVLALAMFVYGGLMWMTSAGNKERVDKAQKTVIWSILGLVIIFASYALVSFVLSALGQ